MILCSSNYIIRAESKTTYPSTLTDTMQTNFTIKDSTIIEETTLTDFDNSKLHIYRTINQDGSGLLTITKNYETIISTLENQNYESYLEYA